MDATELLDIAMSLGDGVPPEAKIDMMMKLDRKTDSKDWSCAYIAHVLEKLGYEYSKLDIPESYKYIGTLVHSGSKPGDIIVYNTDKGSKVGIIFKVIKQMPAESDSKGKAKVVNKPLPTYQYLVVTSDSETSIVKELIDLSNVIVIKRMKKQEK